MMPPPVNQTPLTVFVSGSGRSLTNLITRATLPASHPNSLKARVHRVIASRECKAADIARDASIETHVLPRSLSPQEVIDLTSDTPLAVLAGYLRLLHVPDERKNQIINIHPALLPPLGPPDNGGRGKHGLAAHAHVLSTNPTHSGCTVHFADDTYDTGDVILQRTCPVQPGDTPETLAARVFELELDALPEAINQLVET